MDIAIASHTVSERMETVLALGAGREAAYAGSTSGLFRSVDGGLTWAPTSVEGAPVQAIALSPGFERDRTLWVGGEWPGLLRSADGGDTWELQTLAERVSSTTALALSPLYLQDGVMLAGTAGDGVLRSTDRGYTWKTANFGLLDLVVLGLAAAPDWSGEETVFAITPGGLFRSANGGRAWRMVEGDVEDQPGLAMALSPSFARDGLAYLATEGNGLWRSRDGGETWEFAGLDCEVVNSVVFSPRFETDGTIYAGASEQGLCRSTDGGATWTPFAVNLPPVLAIAAQGDRLFCGTYGNGLYVLQPHP